ncbi:MAG: transketolase, partial [Miltoncostaeaceae bacterium]|nr:transketolase [Miltoncostaeaceae bacterium]
MSVVLAPPERSVTTIRTLAIDAVERANSGHPGAPMGLAAVGWALFTGPLRHSPANPRWPDRDRFVLSNGHASMLLYALLHLTGYDLTLEDLKSFRQWGSRTPGHPEYGLTPGVEITTGPLGQGFANSVGFALAERMLAARYNRPGHEVVDHRTWFMCSDGDMMEGISHEAASLAGFLKLGRLIGIYDDNRISLDGPTSLSFGEDVPARFLAYGWRVLTIQDANDLDEIGRVFQRALEPLPDEADRPTLIDCHSHIGFGSPHKQDSAASHGAALGEEEVALTKRAYGWPEDAQFLVPPDVAAWRDEMIERGRAFEQEWEARVEAYAGEHPHLAAELVRVLGGQLPVGWDADLPRFSAAEEKGGKLATRVASGRAINGLAPRLPELVGGAADLATSTNTTIGDGGDVAPGSFAGRNLHYGVREHAMGAITNGLAVHGGLRPFGATFLQFSDYMKNTLRLAALMEVPSIFVYTHDSVALGEDGPTHQPIEHLAGLRAIPHLVTIRPGDANEAAQAWRVAIARHGPTAIILTRQGLPILDGPAHFERGAYVLAEGDDCILIGTGSEVSVALAARELLAADGIGARVVSMPSFELFAAQGEAYRRSVLPP